jgi:hypothetical protein
MVVTAKGLWIWQTNDIDRIKAILIATGYGLDSLHLIPSRGEIFLFSTVFRLPLGPTQPPVEWLPGALSLGVKKQRHDTDHSPPSAAEVSNGEAISTTHMSSGHSA